MLLLSSGWRSRIWSTSLVELVGIGIAVSLLGLDLRSRGCRTLVNAHSRSATEIRKRLTLARSLLPTLLATALALLGGRLLSSSSILAILALRLRGLALPTIRLGFGLLRGRGGNVGVGIITAGAGALRGRLAELLAQAGDEGLEAVGLDVAAPLLGAVVPVDL
jgi:hypothetical protein